MRITMIRHGQTIRNLQNRVLGRSDFPLDETGLEQARLAGLSLADQPFSAIYSSPLKRAVQTAQAIAQARDDSPVIEMEPRLIEQNFGVFEGIHRLDPKYQKEKHLYFKPFEGGESFLDVAARVYSFLDELPLHHHKDDHILVVAHGGICRLIENYFTGMDNEQFPSYFLQNCEYRTFDFDEIKRDTLKGIEPVWDEGDHA